jgi:hypothetical protein
MTSAKGLGAQYVRAGTGKKVAVTGIGLITVLWGGAHAIMGGMLVFASTTWDKDIPPDDPVGGFAFLLQIVAALATAIGIAFLVQGVLGVAAGWGVVLRKQWARIVTLVLAGLFILWGLLALSAYEQGVSNIAFGGAQVLYGIVALFILIKDRAEFSRPRI